MDSILFWPVLAFDQRANWFSLLLSLSVWLFATLRPHKEEKRVLYAELVVVCIFSPTNSSDRSDMLCNRHRFTSAYVHYMPSVADEAKLTPDIDFLVTLLSCPSSQLLLSLSLSA